MHNILWNIRREHETHEQEQSHNRHHHRRDPLRRANVPLLGRLHDPADCGRYPGHDHNERENPDLLKERENPPAHVPVGVGQHDLLALLADEEVGKHVDVDVDQDDQPDEDPLDHVEVEGTPVVLGVLVLDVAPPGVDLGVAEAEGVDALHGEEAADDGEEEEEDEPADFHGLRDDELVGFLDDEVEHYNGDE